MISLNLTFLDNPLVPPLIFIIFTLFGMGYLLPRTWIHLERAIWKLVFDSSPASDWIINIALLDFKASIREIEVDENAPRTLATGLAICRRLKEFPSLYTDLKRMQEGKAEAMFTAATDKLNEGWRSGTPARLLEYYINIILALAEHPAISKRERIRGLSSVALVRYANGDLKFGQRLGEQNWLDAGRLPVSDRIVGRWEASYARQFATLFLGHFEKAMDLMADQWTDHYAELNKFEQARLREELIGLITLHPILALPRHITLAAAFSDGCTAKLKNARYWPNPLAFSEAHRKTTLKDLEREILFVDAWYEEAKTICASDLISLNFSHAYFAFYCTLLLLDPKLENRLRDELHAKIKHAFNSIEEPAPIVSRYAKHGFSGIFYLACNRNHEALDSLRLAAVYSSISGNSFASCLFMCCHAVAAQRLRPAVDTEVNYYLKEAKKLAHTIGGDFYPQFWAQAAGAVASLQGRSGRTQRYLLRTRQGQKRTRLMRLFEADIQEASRIDSGLKSVLQP